MCWILRSNKLLRLLYCRMRRRVTRRTLSPRTCPLFEALNDRSCAGNIIAMSLLLWSDRCFALSYSSSLPTSWWPLQQRHVSCTAVIFQAAVPLFNRLLSFRSQVAAERLVLCTFTTCMLCTFTPFMLCTFTTCMLACSSWYMYDLFCYVPRVSPPLLPQDPLFFYLYPSGIKQMLRGFSPWAL